MGTNPPIYHHTGNIVRAAGRARVADHPVRDVFRGAALPEHVPNRSLSGHGVKTVARQHQPVPGSDIQIQTMDGEFILRAHSLREHILHRVPLPRFRIERTIRPNRIQPGIVHGRLSHRGGPRQW